jgi:hypothetical protein
MPILLFYEGGRFFGEMIHIPQVFIGNLIKHRTSWRKNSMSDEISANTKYDVIDFVIQFLIDKEKNLDNLIQRLEKAVVNLSKTKEDQNGQIAENRAKKGQDENFKITLTNQGKVPEIKSIKIEWNIG